MKFFILLLPVLCLVVPARGAALTEAKFSQIVKDVKIVVRATETTVSAKVDDTFKAPDLIRTGADSLAELIAPDKTITRVGANTVFSFEKAGRAINLEQGSVLFHSPKGKGGGSIRTKGASAAVLGTTIVVTATPGGGFKAIVLEGKGQITLPNGNFRVLTAGQVTFVLPGSQQFGPQLNINLGKLVESSRLVQGFEGELPSKPVIQAAVERQLVLLTTGRVEDTNILLGNQATTETVATVDPVTVQQAVDERRDELAIARETDVTVRTSNLGATVIQHLFLDPTAADFAALGVLNFSGFIGRNITLATSAIDFTPYLGQTDFTIGATEVLQIERPVMTAATALHDLELTATPVVGRPPLLRTVRLVGKTGLTIASGMSIGASMIGDVSFVSGAQMSLLNVSFYNPNGKLELKGLGSLNLAGGGVNAQSLALDGSAVNVLNGIYSASGDAVVRASSTLLNTDGTMVQGNNVSLEARTTADLHDTTATASTFLNLNAQQDLKIGGGNYSVSETLGTAQLYAGRDIFMGNATAIQARTIQMNAGNNANLNGANLSGFNSLAVTAARELTVSGGTANGILSASSTASFTAGDSIAINDTSFGNLATLTLTAPLLTLNNVGLPNASTVDLRVPVAYLSGATFSWQNVTLQSPAGRIEVDASVSADLRATTATAATALSFHAQQDLRLEAGAYSVSSSSGTIGATAGRDLTVVSATDIQARTIQMSAGNNATLTAPVFRGFNTLNVNAVQGLTVNSGSFTGVPAGPATAQVNLTAGETLSVNGVSFANVLDISLSARTVNLESINFLNGTTVNLYSQLGQLAANPNTGAASVPGHVNFIRNVNYDGNPAQLYVGSTINISARP